MTYVKIFNTQIDTQKGTRRRILRRRIKCVRVFSVTTFQLNKNKCTFLCDYFALKKLIHVTVVKWKVAYWRGSHLDMLFVSEQLRRPEFRLSTTVWVYTDDKSMKHLLNNSVNMLLEMTHQVLCTSHVISYNIFWKAIEQWGKPLSM